MSESIRVRMKLHNVAGSYFIRSVDTDDEGRYICVVSNSLGKKELPVNVTVLGRTRPPQTARSLACVTRVRCQHLRTHDES